MRVLYVTDALAIWGGIERVLSDKMNYLVRELGYDIFVVTADQGEHPIPFQLDNRIHIMDLNIRFHQQYSFHGFKRILKHRELEKLFRNRLSSYINEIKPDVISCIRDGYARAVLDIENKIPVIFESHAMYKDIEYENSTFIHRYSTYFFRRKFKKLNKLVTLTQGDADDWRKVCHNVIVIPNVVHLNESGRYSQCKEKRAVFAGRFDLQKDFGTLVRIWEIVQINHPDWCLDVYGNGQLKHYYEQIIYEKKLNIIIHPAVPDIIDKFIGSSMLLMSSLYEPFGLVLVEAMSCGIPVVAFDCPFGPADVINDGVDGFLVADRDIQAYANRVCQLINDEQLRLKMGRAAIQSSQRYRSEIIMPKWDKLFHGLVDKL